MKKLAIFGGGSLLSGVVTFLALPAIIGLGAASACACEKRMSENLAKWETCARKIAGNHKSAEFWPTHIVVMGSTPQGQHITGETKIFNSHKFFDFLDKDVTPVCGSFESARSADIKTRWWREFYGYDDLYLPESAHDVLARTEVTNA